MPPGPPLRARRPGGAIRSLPFRHNLKPALEQKRLLVHTELSVKELAARTGFAEPTNLVKFFRHHVGATPLEFRDRHRRGFLPSGRRS